MFIQSRPFSELDLASGTCCQQAAVLHTVRHFNRLLPPLLLLWRLLCHRTGCQIWPPQLRPAADRSCRAMCVCKVLLRTWYALASSA